MEVPEEAAGFKVPTKPAEYRLSVLGSKFLAWCEIIRDEAEAMERLKRRQRLHPDATHNCWAYRIGLSESPQEHSSDAGEPSGTAGRPILDQMRRVGVVNALVVVSRWFGGQKLGKGGLARAYSAASSGVLQTAAYKRVHPLENFALDCPYPLIGAVERVAAKQGGTILSAEYGSSVKVTVSVPAERAAAFRAALNEATAGLVNLEKNSN